MNILIAILLGTVAAPPAPASPEKILAKVQATYRSAGDVEAEFTQVHVDKLRNKRRQESGRLWAKVDGRVRWTYTTPVRKDFVFDGKSAFFYEPENAQVTVFERFQDSPLWSAVRFLWGQGDVSASFTAKACAKDCEIAGTGEVAVELWPKEPIPTVDHSLAVIDSGTGRVRASVVFDPLGNRTEYHFSKVTFGAKIADSKFQFEVPKGASILRAGGAEPNKK